MDDVGILLDFDGTLVDSESAHLRVWNEVLAEFGVAIEPAQYKADHTGVPAPQSARHLVDAHGLPVTPEELTDRKSALTQRFLRENRTPLRPNVLETLEWFRERSVPMALVTGSPREEITHTMRHWGLEPFFVSVTTRDDVRHSKPHPESYRRALATLDLTPERAVAFEDTSTGVESAVAAGVACVAIPNEYSDGQDFSAATHVARSLHEARVWTEAMFGL